MRHPFLFLLFAVPLWGQDLDIAPAKPVGPSNIESALWELAIPSAAKPTRAADGPRAVVILVPVAGVAATIDTTAFAALGVEILARSKSLMRVSVPTASLRAVSELPSVAFVRRPRRPHAQQTVSEGVARIRALEHHAAGAKGQGVKVAIIDGGFKGADKLRDDMPVRRWFRDYTHTGIYAGTDAHGTACAEIIHDVAPEAELYLYKVADEVDLENAKDRCIQNGVAIVNYSATWVNEGFGDGRGIICDIVNDAADNGILWVNAVGNYAQKHYAGFWHDSDADNRHNFAAGDDAVNFVAEIGDAIRVTLTWDDWPTTTQDYDLYLYHQDAFGNIKEVDKSTDVQGDGGAPVEFIEYFAGQEGTYGISVVRVGEAEPKELRVWSWHHDIEYPVSAGSLGIPSDARGALSVGAIHHDQWDLGTTGKLQFARPHCRWPHQARPRRARKRDDGFLWCGWVCGDLGCGSPCGWCGGPAQIGQPVALARRSMEGPRRGRCRFGGTGQGRQHGIRQARAGGVSAANCGCLAASHSIRPNNYYRRPGFRRR